ncbi:hypothetical protein MKX01_037922 [Papaver californicum]|nr:hypothetical protein MKX01_037922 [Papaver californicum]
MDGNCSENPLNSLTEDLLIEILLWLPVVSLLRFKAVCKYWRSVIESSENDIYQNDRYPQANIVGSCHGIICIHDPHLRDIFLWTPATKKFRSLPKSLPIPEEFGGILTDFVMFGFDCETYDYKVVQITFFENDVFGTTPKNQVQIYSLLSDSWRWCIDANLYSHSYKSNNENQGRYLNGCYYS